MYTNEELSATYLDATESSRYLPPNLQPIQSLGATGINSFHFEAFTKRTQRRVIRAVANKLIKEARQ